jgi:hypothetical protein
MMGILRKSLDKFNSVKSQLKAKNKEKAERAKYEELKKKFE